MSKPEPLPFSPEELAEWLGLPELAMEGDVRRFTGPQATHYRAILEVPEEERISVGEPEDPFGPAFEGETITSAE